MAKALRTVAIVAGSIALIATGVGAIAGSATLIAGVSVGTIAATASAVATTASIGATALQKKPPAQGSLNQVLIGNNLPIPYAMGRTYVPGLMVYDDSGGTDNRYRFQINVITAAGPIDSIEQRLVDFNNTTFVSGEAQGWYANFLSWQDKLGTRPDTAFTSGGTAIPGWGTSHKLSGYAAYRAKMLFDKDAKRFASGVPQFGVVGKMVLVYDPRLDSTYPGGSGPHRWDDESTWTWSENPGLHALSYARGRFIEKTAAGVALARPIKICGIGYSKDGIDIPIFVELANLCTANGWKVGGTVYEAPGSSKWDNLKRICQAGGAIPTFSGGVLTLKLSAPRPSLFTITADDLAGPASVRSAKSWRERKNSIVPRYRSATHKWEYVQGKEVTGSTYLTEDGELKSEEIQFDLVQDLTQATELAAYELVNGRELGPITLTLKPRLLLFRIGEGGIIDLPEAGLVNQPVVIIGRQVDIASGTVTLTFETETAAKHAYALGQTGEAPPTPVLRSSQELDEAVYFPASLAELDAIANAQLQGKITTFYQSAAPVSTAINDQWFNTTSGKWYIARIVGADAIAAGEWELVEDASIAAALTAAAGAQATADGKIVSWYQNAQPVDPSIGDLWVRPSDNPKRVYRWSGTAWEVQTPTSLAELDEVAAEALAASAASIADQIDNGILDPLEKKGPLATLVADLEQRYVQVTARAAAAGVTIGALTTARTQWLGYLNAQAPRWNDFAVPTRIYNPFFPTENLADWSLGAGTTRTVSAPYHIFTDPSTTARTNVQRSGAAIGGDAYSVGMVVQKAAAQGRQALFSIQGLGGTTKAAALRFDPFTGAMAIVTANFDATGVHDLGDDWFVWGRITLDPTNTTLDVRVEPANAAAGSSTSDVAQTGSIAIKTFAARRGNQNGLGRYMLQARASDYVKELQAALAAISARDATTAFLIPSLPDTIIACDYQGNIKPGELPRNVAFKANVGTANVTTATAWTRDVKSGVTDSIGAADGVLSITALSVSDVTHKISGTYLGVTREVPHRIRKVNDPPPSGGSGSGAGSSASDNSFGSVSSTTATVISDVLEIVAATTTINLAANLTISTTSAAPAGTFDVQGRWQEEIAAVWTDVGTATSSNPDCTVVAVTEPGVPTTYDIDFGTLVNNVARTGKTVGTAYKFRFRAWNTTGTRIMTFSGNASATS